MTTDDNNVNYDSLLTQMGYYYQYLVALRDAFDLLPGESLVCEKKGDITKQCGEKILWQKEVKFHESENVQLTDRATDFWKTLSNWYEDYEQLKGCESFTLYTTSGIKADSKLFNWNSLSPEGKMAILKAIGKQEKKREETFRALYKKIFDESFDEERLKDILSKFSIDTKKESKDLLMKILDTRISDIRKEHRDLYLASLMGKYIIDAIKIGKQVTTYEDFCLYRQSLTDKYSQHGGVLFPRKEVEKEAQSIKMADILNDKVFVAAIKNIELDDEIPTAKLDYWKERKASEIMMQRDPLAYEAIEDFKEDVLDGLVSLKSEVKNTSEKEGLDASRELFYKAKNKDYKAENRFQAPPPFYQRGMIHENVEDKKFEWTFEDEFAKH